MSRMTPAMISEIKRALWNGSSQQEIAELYSISQPAVSNVKRGTIGASIPWPNGKIGRMPARTSSFDSSAGWSSNAVEYMTYPEDMQARILAAVNEYITNKGEDPIPEISVEYEIYLSGDKNHHSVEGQQAAALAQEAENLRRTRIMEVYHYVLGDYRQRRRMSELKMELATLAAEIPNLDILGVQTETSFIYTKMPLEKFKSLCERKHPILAECEARKNIEGLLMQEALLVVANTWKGSPANWLETFFFRQVKEVYEILRGYPEIIERIKNGS